MIERLLQQELLRASALGSVKENGDADGLALWVFLLGTATGAVGGYLASKYTDRRREQEARRNSKAEFLRIKAEMPEFIAETKNDLLKEGDKHVREFFVLRSRKEVPFSVSKLRFSYCIEDHSNLLGKISILENMGYLENLTPKDIPAYRMTEQFVSLVLKYG